MKVIIWENENGQGVSVCTPVEMPIDHVMAHDTPQHLERHVIEHTEIPEDTSDYSEAWKIRRDESGHPRVVLDHESAKAVAHAKLNLHAREAHQNRTLNKAIGLPVQHTDEEFLANVQTARKAIENSTTLDHLRSAIESIKT